MLQTLPQRDLEAPWKRAPHLAAILLISQARGKSMPNRTVLGPTNSLMGHCMEDTQVSSSSP